jgi:hypothetical protein
VGEGVARPFEVREQSPARRPTVLSKNKFHDGIVRAGTSRFQSNRDHIDSVTECMRWQSLSPFTRSEVTLDLVHRH